MSSTATGRPHDRSWYEIRLQGRLDARWSVWFDGLTLTAGADGTTTIRGPVVDQAALHGLLQRLRDLGLPLISVAQVEPDPASLPTPRRSAQPEHWRQSMTTTARPTTTAPPATRPAITPAPPASST